MADQPTMFTKSVQEAEIQNVCSITLPNYNVTPFTFTTDDYKETTRYCVVTPVEPAKRRRVHVVARTEAAMPTGRIQPSPLPVAPAPLPFFSPYARTMSMDHFIDTSNNTPTYAV